MLVNPTKSRHSSNISSSIVRSKGSRTLNTLAQAVVVHAALTPSPAYSGLNKETGMGKEWGRGGGVSGRQKDRVSSHVAASE
eukprot:scaffold322_cov109-Isochrysis_galbana.AAC.7